MRTPNSRAQKSLRHEPGVVAPLLGPFSPFSGSKRFPGLRVRGRSEYRVDKSRRTRCDTCEHLYLFLASYVIDWARVIECMVNFSPNLFHKRTYLDLARNLCSRCRLNYVMNAGIHCGTGLDFDAVSLEKISIFVIPRSSKRPVHQLVLLLSEDIAENAVDFGELPSVEVQNPYSSQVGHLNKEVFGGHRESLPLLLCEL